MEFQLMTDVESRRVTKEEHKETCGGWMTERSLRI